MTKYPQVNINNTPGFIVKVKDVPQAYWAKHKRAWDCGLAGFTDKEVQGRIELVGASIAPISEEMGATQGGAYSSRGHQNTWCWIPATYFEPEMNEYGEVAP